MDTSGHLGQSQGQPFKEMILVRLKLTRTAIALLAASALVTSPSGAQAAKGTKTSFAVSTQFSPDPSPIVAATGPLTACTTVTDLGGDTVDTGPNTVLFTGRKRLNCDGGTVVLSYEARLNLAAGRKTFGTWTILESTLSGVETGGGRLKGDSARCEIVAGSEGCILDVFTGYVRG
jgi:hypothetical protein